MAVVVKGGFAGPGAGGVNGTGQQGVWRREITCTEVSHCIIREEVIIMMIMRSSSVRRTCHSQDEIYMDRFDLKNKICQGQGY